MRDKNILLFNLDYLKRKGYIEFKEYSQTFFAKIASRGVDLVENPKELNKILPIPILLTQNIVQNSTGVIINSDNASINIQDSFNNIYQRIPVENPENNEEIKMKVEKLEKELKKDKISKSKVQECYNWLKRNANWTIPTITQIITATFI